MKYESTHWLLYWCIGDNAIFFTKKYRAAWVGTLSGLIQVWRKTSHTLSAQTVSDIHWIESCRLLELFWVIYTTEIKMKNESSSIKYILFYLSTCFLHSWYFILMYFVLYTLYLSHYKMYIFKHFFFNWCWSILISN